jgi:acetolactate decarboxylase
MTMQRKILIPVREFVLLAAVTVHPAGAQLQTSTPVAPDAHDEPQTAFMLECSNKVSPPSVSACKFLPSGLTVLNSYGHSRNSQQGEVFQVSTLDALSLGIFQASMSVRELRRHGDFGVGTFDGLDGEMVALDGRFYQIRSDGAVSRVENDALTPFAVVTDFKPSQSLAIRGPATREQVFAALDQMLQSSNYFYAVKVQGQFSSVTARSVPRQIQPYPTLAQVVAQQTVFPLQNIRGTLVGFRSPAFVKGINQPGYHFHFISDDQRSGGHALDFEVSDAIVEIQTIRRHSTILPEAEPFRDAPLPLP